MLISVHAFASDPARGLFILLLLSVITGGALLLYAMRANKMEAEGGFHLVSREAFLLLNNILLLVATAAVLFGTLYPLFLDALGLGKISVGPPYFNSVFLIPMMPMLVLLGAGMHASWLSQKGETLARKLAAAAGIAVVMGIVAPFVVYGASSLLTVVGLVLGFWVVLTSLWDPVTRAFRREPRPMPLSRAQWGMSLAHFGIGVFIMGVTVTSSFGIETDQSLRPGESVDVAGYTFEFRDVRQVEGVNYEAVEGEFEVRRDGQLVTILTPQKRVYLVQQSPMTEAAIDPALNRDLFVALGDPLGGGAWSVRIQYKPFIRFIWLGTLFMAFGGLLAATDRRYRTASQKSRAVSSTQPVTESA